MEAASLSSQKTAIWLFVAKYAALTFIATRICFGLLATKLGFFEAYSKKNMFCFVCRQIGHFPAICSGKWISFPIFNEWRWFFLDGTQNNVLACFLAKLRCFKHYLSKNNLYHFFLHEIRFWRSNLSKTPFGLFAANLSWFELCVTKESVFPFLCLK